MGLLDALFCLLLLVLIAGTATAAEQTPGSKDGNSTHDHPSGAMLAGCPTSCGNLSFDYPFGMGSAQCSWSPDFNLTCDNTAQPPRLYLPDAATEVTDDIVVRGDGDGSGFPVAISHAVLVRPGTNMYNMSWKAPGKAFTLEYAELNITGCNFDIYLHGQDTNTTVKLCTVTCPDAEITDKMARENCNGTGCCSIPLFSNLRAFEFRFVLHNRGELHSSRSSLWHSINLTSHHANINWSIVDEPTCASTLDNRTKYACVSSHSMCYDNSSNWTADRGYRCRCERRYKGNPYVPDGCSLKPDKGYNPYEKNCRRSCGNINVPYPFGLDEGCFGRKLFELNCTDETSSTLQFGHGYHVTYMDISKGHMGVTNMSGFGRLEFSPYDDDEPELFFGSGNSSYLQWAVADLSCQEAKMNLSGYACLSTNSICLGVNSTDGYVGYRCKCTPGFDGNPYVEDGCDDINECSKPDICRGGVCLNTFGGYYCSDCPENTEFHPKTRRCTPKKKQNFISGIIIGLSSGLGSLLFCLSATALVRRWKRNIQDKLRRKYFEKNQGLLLEQLILSDENANDNTKIFTMEELEKATNNFDPTRILGRGGHGMVYKGILSDQRVVAIKRSKDIEQGDISQFINEVAILSHINHRNIVKLFGCCLETEVPLLVYDFIANGSLFDVLHSCSDSGNSLSWNDCLRIATETAGALCYLHSAASVSVFHRDVKSSNILLDCNYTAKVADFGASRVVPIDQTHVVTNVQGTFGYLDPEYYQTGQLNEKSDVYSFGVVLSELLLGRKPIFTTETGSKMNLANFFLSELKLKPVKDIVAPQVCEDATEEEINSVANLAEMCLRLHGEERPTMKQVEMTLQFLRTERKKACLFALENAEDMQALSCTISEPRSDSLGHNMGADADAYSVPPYSEQGFTFELECASSVGQTL